MTNSSTAKLLLLFLLSSTSSHTVVVAADPQPSSPQQAKQIQTLMCTTEGCTDADENTPGCKQYTTPLNTCYNAKNLFPNDESWSDLDIYDEMIMRNLKRSFYQSTDGTCAGRGEGATNIPQPVDGDDSFIIPLGDCVGPFGPPRPWGKFTALDGDDESDSEVLSSV
eukprot:CAMPEP_0172297964 /NCGR_PEP_ID=MMETSP1058-20130122/810_1 /TAXON_ID=83371 /ORGANISM="Detonula confervacea, Strain CCMP 353" /LENGTH=166 /DNA_ID=CAMNT_0013007191 /DNA_START=24 /DNA_END=524 /DNA_ORIENTATION=+